MTDPRPAGPAAAGLPWLGICPLLGGADTTTHGLALGAVTLAVLAGTHLAARHLRGRVGGGTHVAGLLLVAVGTAVVLRLACEALAFELALATGGLFALAAVHGAAAADAAEDTPGLVRRVGLPGATALVLVGAVRDALGPASLLPAAALLVVAVLAAGAQRLRRERA